MDEQQLDQILQHDTAPPADINARKIALNLAVAEFKAAQNEKNIKSPQGIFSLSRLMGRSQTHKGRNPMDIKKRKKIFYGGMATAMAVVLISSVTMNQMQKPEIMSQPMNYGANNFSSIAANVTSSAIQLPDVTKWFGQKADSVSVGASGESTASVQAPQAYSAAVEEKKEIGADYAASAVPAPAEAEVRRIAEAPAPKAKAMEADASDKIGDMAVLRKEVPMQANGAVSNMVVMPISPPVDDTTPIYRADNRDQFTNFTVNSFKQVTAEPVSTFSSDVDTASYSFMRRQLNNGMMPAPDSVRVEEMINYFDYNYAVPDNRAEPFLPNVVVTDSPWAQGKKLLHVGIKGFEITGEKPRTNLVFLLDVSGSMNEPNKLPLVKASMKMLLDTLRPDDTVAIAVYAGAAGAVLEPTKVSERAKIFTAIDNLNAGGSTAGEAGIKLAYDLAAQNFNNEAVNRVILATDGDFNVGTSSPEELKSLVEKERERGIFLSVLGFGQGNYNDAIMQTLAQNGNGVAAYIDTLGEAQKVLVEEATSSLFPIAKDVKFQVEFNPKAVAEYRLIGYETRALNREDFNNDKIDAGDMGAGHTVTAIYEFVPAGSAAVSMDPLRYADEVAKPAEPQNTNDGEYAFVKIRYKLPNENTSKLITRPVSVRDDVDFCPPDAKCERTAPSDDVRFSTAVAAFGQMLQGGQYTGNYTYDDVIALAQSGKGADTYGRRAEFINLVRLAKTHQHP